MNLDESLQRLFSRNLHLIKLDLEPMTALVRLLGDPHRSYVCIHVAGTNGKGSVCAMLAAMLTAQGYRTGLYTSPHLVKFNERIQVDGAPIDDAELTSLIEDVETAAKQLPDAGQRDVTFFEFTTALAFLHFQRAGVEVAVIETGMGGRLDATNVIIPAVSVITSIGLEHQQFLGDTMAKIAGEKAGIIKAGRPVVVGELPDEAMAVTQARARALNAPLHAAVESVEVAVRSVRLDGQTVTISSAATDYGTIHLKLSGLHQAANAAVAVATAECLDREVGVPVSAEAIKKGLEGACWPARCQLLQSDPPMVLDGAHNPDAAHALAAWLKKVALRRPVGFIVSFLSDKEPDRFMRELERLARRIWIVPVHTQRAMPVEEVRRRIAFLKHVDVCVDLADARTRAEAWAREEHGVIVITGSLYLAGEVLSVGGGR